MIYCIPIEMYPKEGMYIEELTYTDENGFEWRIARVENGFIVRYFGDDYFRDSLFSCEIGTGEIIKVKNTNCIFFKDSDFETFYEMREIIKIGYTDDIWETFVELFTERFEHDRGMLESEMLN